MADVVTIGLDEVQVEIPEGWERVLAGLCQKGDMFINSEMQLFECEPDDIGTSFRVFDCLIREKKHA